ncbi:RNA-binding protein [Peribacillus sp. B-H-3]|jgi:RNA-binding protein YlmH|uniref:YlmH family RNA-binding protein n=1 Tax=Peribacillus sp. B-H-3 TaxID=3400420 RepID=UPI003B0205F7
MSIYQHFRPEEKDFIDTALGWAEYVKSAYSPKLTDFLDPRQQHILASLLGKDDEARLQFFGGNINAERKRALIYPEYLIPSEDDFQVSLYAVHYPAKFVTLEHRQILGTLMSIGLKREKFGDILIMGETVQFLAAQEINHYLEMNLERIGKSSVSIQKISMDQILDLQENWQEQMVTVSSMRLDAVLSSVINLSRQKAQVLISSGKVKVNFKETENTSVLCEEGDTLSARGFGRVRILSVEGKTKKDKWRILVGRQK